jgi:hypothetical protein
VVSMESGDGGGKPKQKRGEYQSAVPEVLYKLPRCLGCGRSRFRIYATRERGDDDDLLEQYAQCRFCGTKHRLVGQ